MSVDDRIETRPRSGRKDPPDVDTCSARDPEFYALADGNTGNCRLNLKREELLAFLVAPGDQIDVFSYVVASVYWIDDRFVQAGCGPNFLGGMLTLCTCKHLMRSALAPADSVGKWVAGFARVGAVPDRPHNHLVYLTRVTCAFASQRDLWESCTVPEAAKRRKSAHRNRLGDLYEPKARNPDPYDPDSYRLPTRNILTA